MASARGEAIRVAFNAGEWKPGLDSRSDLERATMACRALRNMRLVVHGMASRRPGLRYIATAKAASPGD